MRIHDWKTGPVHWKQWLSRLSRLLPAFAAPPSGTELRTSWNARNGSRITLRVARRRDAPLMQALVHDLSMPSRYRRFLFPLRELPPEMLARFVRIDVTRNVSLLATIERDGEEIAIAMGQYAVGAETYRADFGIVVADAWQHEGIGSCMLEALASVAHAAGFERLEGDVLADNAPMRGLLAKQGFSVRPHPDGAHLVRVGKRLAESPQACSQLIAVVRNARLQAERQRLQASAA